MTKHWAGLTFGALAALAISTSGCDAIKKLVSARMEKPTIGLRTSLHSPLDEKSEVKKAKGLGCDVRFYNVPAGSTINVQWHHYLDEEGHEDKDVEQSSDTHSEAISGSNTFHAFLEGHGDGLADGIYECEFNIKSSKTIDGGKQSAKIKVGKVPKSASGKDKDDDDGDSKKKKKKSKDDDE